MKQVRIIEVDNFLNTNLYNKLTKVCFNIVEDGEITDFGCAQLKGRISMKKSKLILDTVFMSKEDYFDLHKVLLDRNLQDKYIEFCYGYND